MILAVHGRRATFALELKATRKDLQGNVIEYDYDPPQTDIIRVTMHGQRTLENLDVLRKDNVLHLAWTPTRKGKYHLDVRILTYAGVRMFARLSEPIEVIHHAQIPEGKDVKRDLAYTLKLNRI